MIIAMIVTISSPILHENSYTLRYSNMAGQSTIKMDDFSQPESSIDMGFPSHVLMTPEGPSVARSRFLLALQSREPAIFAALNQAGHHGHPQVTGEWREHGD